jgi:tyrosine-protein kinase
METANSSLAPEEFDLHRWAELLRRRKWTVLVVVALVVVATGLYTFSQTPRYHASAEVLLRPSTAEQILAGTDSAFSANQNIVPVNIQTEIEYMKSRSIRDAVRKQLGAEPSATIGLANESERDSEVVSIRSSSADAKRAAVIANVYAKVYVHQRRQELSDEYTQAATRVSTEVDDLTNQLNALDAPLDDIDAQIANAQTPQDVSVLVSRRSAVEAHLQPERDPIVNRLDSAKDREASLKLALSGIDTGGAQIISAAVVPDSPYTPKPARNLVLAIFVGLLLGIGVAFLREVLDDRLASASTFERITGWPVIGLVPRRRSKRGNDGRAIALGEAGSAVSEAYRMLCTSVQFEGLNRSLRVIMVTSAKHGEGKSTTVANLGVTLALDGNRVLVVDCDLRHHRLHEFFDIGNDPGLAEAITGEVHINDAVVAIDAQRLLSVLPPMAAADDSAAIEGQRLLSVLPAGTTQLSPPELLASKSAGAVFRQLRERYDYVLVDAPPVLPVSDVAVLTRHVDGVLFLADDAVSRQGPIRRAVRLLKQVEAPVIGAVVNTTPVHKRDSSGYYGSYMYSSGGYGRDPGAERGNGLAPHRPAEDDRLPTAVPGWDVRDR